MRCGALTVTAVQACKTMWPVACPANMLLDTAGRQPSTGRTTDMYVLTYDLHIQLGNKNGDCSIVLGVDLEQRSIPDAEIHAHAMYPSIVPGSIAHSKP